MARPRSARASACPYASSSTRTRSIRHFLSLILHGGGIDTEELADGKIVRRGAGATHARSRLPQYRARIRPDHRSARDAVQAWLFRLRPADEQPRLGGARACQERGRSAPAADAAGAEEAVRHRCHQADHAGPQARPSGLGGRPHRSRRGAPQGLDRILASAENRLAQEAACRRRGVRARPPSAIRHSAARRLHAGRDRDPSWSLCPSWRSPACSRPG